MIQKIKKLVARIFIYGLMCNNRKGIYLKKPCSHYISKKAQIDIKGRVLFNNQHLPNQKNIKGGFFRIEDNATFQCNGSFRFFSGCSLIITKNVYFKIGNGGFMNTDGYIMCNESITIGDNVVIARNVTIRDSDGHSLNGNNMKSPIIIGNKVWIGTNSTILKGVTVEDGAVVAAGSLVNKNVPAKCLVGGVPAKILKENVEWN